MAKHIKSLIRRQRQLQKERKEQVQTTLSTTQIWLTKSKVTNYWCCSPMLYHVQGVRFNFLNTSCFSLQLALQGLFLMLLLSTEWITILCPLWDIAISKVDGSLSEISNKQLEVFSRNINSYIKEKGWTMGNRQKPQWSKQKAKWTTPLFYSPIGSA